MTFRVQWYDDVASTNDVALAAAEEFVELDHVLGADRVGIGEDEHRWRRDGGDIC